MGTAAPQHGALRGLRYQQVADTLRQAIAGGAHPVGGLLPTETELCERFQVSRFTVREALRQLAEEGLVSRRQGSGTVVLAQTAPRRYRQSLENLEDVWQYARDTRLRLGPGRDIEPAAAPGPLEGAAGTCRHYVGVRLDPAGGPPIAAVEVFIDAAFAGVEAQINQQDGAIFRVIEAMYGARVAEIRQEIRAVALSASAAERLGARAGEPGLRVQRRYLDADGRLLVASVSDHAADRFAYTMRLSDSR